MPEHKNTQSSNALEGICEFSTVVELLRYRSSRQAKQLSYTFLGDGETQSDRLTYQELDRSSRAIASQLQSLDLSGERALLLYPPGLEYLAAFFGCLYAGVVAVPAYPPRNQRNTPRILAILEDAQAAVILTTAALLPQLQSLFANKINNIQWLATDNLAPGIEKTWQEPFINTATLAFLQYTSGSTGTPKGVMLSHGNLLHNAVVTRQYMEHSSRSKFVTWLPVYHDMGLIGGVLQPLYGGFPCIMMPPATFLQRPYRWLQTISRYGGTTSGAPDFAYKLCVEKITPEQRSTLDLSSWNVAFNGAEPIRHETLEKFAATFAECGFRPEAFYPCYGMAEATLMVSGSVKNALVTTKTLQKTALESNHIIDATTNDENSTVLVGCGRVVPQQQIVIANPETFTRCEPDEVGEIWVSGPSIGHGYWNRPEETEQTFRAYLQDTGVQRSAHENSEASGPFLRTGDLGFLHNSELFITGRAKDLIIIRGRNLYPQDIELTAERSHKTLRATSVAAFAVEVEKEERLVVVQELEFRAKPNIDEVTAAIRQAITEEHEIEVYAVILIKAGTIPKTSSGKIQRRATKAGFLAGTLDVVGSSILKIAQTTVAEDCLTRTELLAVEAEQQQQLLNSYLQKLVARVLKVTPSHIALEQPLSSLGLDSLKVFELKNLIEVDFGVTISVADFFDGAGIAELTTQILDQVNRNLTSVYLPISKVETATSQHPLTFTQQQLWFINQLQPGTATYNIPVAINLTGKLNVPALVRSLNEIIQRHDILRTSFEVVDGEPIQKVADAIALNARSAIAFSLPEIDLRHFADEQQQTEVQKLSQQEAQSSFDLGQAPLLRAKLLHLQAESILLINLHHLVGDGWSIKVLVQELSTIYQAFCAGKPSQLPQLPVQYTDFVYWQRNWLQGEVIEKHLAYWKQQLGGNLPGLQLPTDLPRPPIQTFRGAQQKFVLSTTLTESIKQLSQQQGATLFMTLLAAFQTLLYRYTDQEDILVGSPIANRNRAELDQLIGCFVNTLVLRTNLEGNPTFTELLGRVRKVAVEAYTHQDLPFEKLVEALQPNRDLSYNPLFQVMFVLQNPASNSIWKTDELETRTAKFDVLLSMIDSEEGLTGTLEYNTDLFNSDTIARMVEHFQTLLEGVVIDPNQGISELSILTPVERQTLLVEWNNTQVDYPQEACIHNLFEAQVEKTPDAIALVFANLELTYRELNNRANQLAHYLENVGVQPETLVGVCMERSMEMVVGILAILKAGAAYVPLDPTYPAERLHFVLEDAQLKFILTQQKQSHKLANDKTQLICLDTDGEIIAQQSTDNPNSQVVPASLAYIIYTSGSTGKPKGVLVNHVNVVRLFAATDAWFKFNQQDVWTLFHSIAFDFSVWEIWGALLYGGRLIVVPYEVSRSPQAFYELLAQQQVTVLNQTPSAFRQLIQVDESVAAAEKLKHLRYVIFGGEALELQSLQPWFERYGDKSPQLVNMYGITETTVHVTYRPLTKADVTQAQGSVIGIPIPDLQVYLLDKHQQLVPIGVPGEMYIGGAGLARGYLNRPELTQQKFISHPFTLGTRLYRSGDLARYLPNGELEYLGRIDNQVKIRGFRIELGEIETTLSQYPRVRETVVLVREDIANHRRLVAYIIPDQKSALCLNELRYFLKRKLPEYMIPSAFVVLETLPLNPNGKVDRRALPAPENLRPELATNYQAPQSEVEKTIAKVWKQVLQIEKVGIHDNFFDLGGHSLLVVQVNNQIRETLKQDLSVVEMFQNPTIKSLAEHLDKKANDVSAFHSMRERTDKQKAAINKQQQFMRKQRQKL
ncbi:non-ribosomal peptide synthetase [aff. Roholtiella sp. LEGE 12411]|uniref:non-ribosomal peptide synthetase n=1 Tax=aff. Roholtiella sp. LEGE 12411 TaxID=1828822 RepID=UPI001881C0A4|nr:non-ribosomal peptide synthetase [aff. Roholtiella sp. LEGE 12411]MBE9034041.1 amino acid adenylation domain-containing protein [aff. Roholtiella sp. LEGE 12411]